MPSAIKQVAGKGFQTVTDAPEGGAISEGVRELLRAEQAFEKAVFSGASLTEPRRESVTLSNGDAVTLEASQETNGWRIRVLVTPHEGSEISVAAFLKLPNVKEPQWTKFVDALKAKVDSTGKAIGNIVEAGLAMQLDRDFSANNTMLSNMVLSKEELGARTFNNVAWSEVAAGCSSFVETTFNGGRMNIVDASGADFTGAVFTGDYTLQKVNLRDAILEGVRIDSTVKIESLDIRGAKCDGLTIDGVSFAEFVESKSVDEIKQRLKGVLYDKRTIFSNDEGIDQAIKDKLEAASIEVKITDPNVGPGGVAFARFVTDSTFDPLAMTLAAGNEVHFALGSLGRAYDRSALVAVKDGENPAEGAFARLFVETLTERGIERSELTTQPTRLAEVGRDIMDYLHGYKTIDRRFIPEYDDEPTARRIGG